MAFTASAIAALLPAPAAAVDIVRGPLIQSTGPGSIIVAWETDVPAPGKVIWGEAGDLSKSAEDTSAARRHELTLTGVAPGATVRYRVLAGTAHSRVGTITAPPAAGEATRFIVLGDTRTMHVAHRSVVVSAAPWASHFVVNTGDLVTRGDSEGDWDAFFAVERPLLATRMSFHVVGNHDRAGDGLAVFRRIFVQPSSPHAPESEFAIDIGCVRLVVLDNGVTGSDGAAQKEWLEQALATAGTAPGIEHVIVAVHHGIHSNGPHGPCKPLWKAGIPEIMKKHGVDLVIAAHDHGYERGIVEGIRYMVTAGGGAPLYSKTQGLGGDLMKATVRHHVRFLADGKALSFEVVLPDGAVLESCTLAAMPEGFHCK